MVRILIIFLKYFQYIGVRRNTRQVWCRWRVFGVYVTEKVKKHRSKPHQHTHALSLTHTHTHTLTSQLHGRIISLLKCDTVSGLFNLWERFAGEGLKIWGALEAQSQFALRKSSLWWCWVVTMVTCVIAGAGSGTDEGEVISPLSTHTHTRLIELALWFEAT